MDENSRPQPQPDYAENGRYVLASPSQIRPFAGQPRSYFDQSAMADLAASISEIGQVLPVLVRPLSAKEQAEAAGNGQQHVYELIDGQRRWHACQMAGVEMMKAVVCVSGDPIEQFAHSLAANFGRADHTPLEITEAIKKLHDNGKTYAQIARIFGKSGQWIYNYARLQSLAPEVREMLSCAVPEHKRLPVSTAIRISSMPADIQIRVARQVVARGLTGTEAGLLMMKHGEKSRKSDRPSKSISILRNMLARSAKVLTAHNELGQAFFNRLLGGNPTKTKQAILNDIDRCLDSLALMRQMVSVGRSKQELASTPDAAKECADAK